MVENVANDLKVCHGDLEMCTCKGVKNAYSRFADSDGSLITLSLVSHNSCHKSYLPYGRALESAHRYVVVTLLFLYNNRIYTVYVKKNSCISIIINNDII